jgi:HK97 family phage major capsid protein
MNPDLQKEMGVLLAKYGLKADGVTPLVVDNAGEPTPPKPAEDAKVVADLAESIAKKLAGIITENKHLNENDHKSVEREVRTKIYTNWGGMKEIEYPSDLKALSKEEKIVTFMKALVFSGHDLASQQVLRALTESDTEGGYLVPEELRTEVFRILPDYAIMRKIARVLPMSTDTLKINSLSARPTAYWTAEYASKSTTSAEFGQISLSPNDLVCLLPVTEQLLADANINLVNFIIQLFTEAIGAAEDLAFFTGSGTGQPKGINQESINSSGTAGATLSFDDVIKLIDMVPQRTAQMPGAAFVGHRNVKRALRQVKTAVTGDYIWRDGKGGTGGGQEVIRLPDTVYGYPYYEQNDLAQSELYFGDWSNYIIGDRQTMSVSTTNVGGDAWRRNALEIKAVERVDGKAVITTPFAKITGI